MKAIDTMGKVAKAIDDINTGYDQSQRWTFIDISKRTLIPNKEGDCSSVCGAIAYLGGYLKTLPTDFYTGNAAPRLTAAGFTAKPFKSLSQLKKGDFVLSVSYHIEYMYDDNTMFSANIDERGKATGGQAGDQTGREVYFKPKFVYRHGWDWVLTPPKGVTPGTFKIVKNYNPAKFSAAYVKDIQTKLVAKGYDIGKAGVDGDLGPATFAAVEKFQRDNKLDVDGIPGPNTLAALNKKVDDSVAKKTISVQGVQVAPGTYAAYERLRAAFKKAMGLDLLITSGYRSYAQQKDLYDRWTGKKQPPFYAPSVAKPGTSKHESGRALDLRDSGASAGVTVAGNPRSNWMRANASKYGFSPNGYSFNEPWHFEYQGDPWAGGSAPSGGSTNKVANDGFSAPYIRDIQQRLSMLGFGVGSSGADGSLGPDTKAAVVAFQKKFGLTKDGLPGPNTLNKLKVVAVQKAVRATQDGSKGPDTNKRLDAVKQSSAWGGGRFPYGVKYTQQVVGTKDDGSWGPNSIAAHDKTVAAIQRAVGVSADGIWGPNTNTMVNSLR